jgi:hypothetical protein
MADSLYYTYIVDKPSSEAFFVPNGFEANVEVHLWGAGGGSGSASAGGAGGYVKSTVTIAEGDFFEITVGGAGGAAGAGAGGAGGAAGQGAGLHSVSFAYGFGGGVGGTGTPYPGGDDQIGGAGGGGGGATVVIVNGAAVAVAAGGGGGGGGYSYQTGLPGKPGGAAGRFTTTSSGGDGVSAYAASGGGGGGYLGGEAGGVNTTGPGGTGDDAGGGGGGYGGQSLGDLSIPGSDTTAGGRTTLYAPKSPPYGNAGYDGYAVLIFKRKYRILYKQAGAWKSVDKVWYKTSVAGVFSNVVSQTFSTVASASAYPGHNYTTAGTYTYTVPSGITTLKLKINGAGGGGGSANSSDIGQNGDLVQGDLSVAAGDIITSEVGAGGVGGVYGGAWTPITLGWAWGSFMETYAIWNGTTSTAAIGSFTYSTTVYFPTTGTYTFLLSADNIGSMYLDSTAIITGFTNYTSYTSTPYSVTAGNHSITLTITNTGGPAGIAAQILKPDSSELWNTRMAPNNGGGAGGTSILRKNSVIVAVAVGGAGGGSGGSPVTGTDVVPAGWTSTTGGGSPGAGGGSNSNGGNGNDGQILLSPIPPSSPNSLSIPVGVTKIYATYPTPNGMKTASFPVTAGEVIAINIGDFGVDSTIKGSAGTLTLPAFDTPVFNYNGNVDHIIAQDVSVATDTGAPLTASGSNATITAAAAAAGITYNVTYEGWHGDLGATISFTPVKKSVCFNNLQVYVASGSGRQFPSAHTYQQQPTVANNYIMNDYQGDYYGGEGSYTWTTNLQQQGYVSISYDQAYTPGTWVPIQNIYYKDSDWKPLINNVDLKALVAKTLIYKGLTTGTFTVPAGTTKVYARLIGGGGGGGGSYNTAAVRGLPGAVVQGAITVTPGDVLTVSVGGGGGGGEDYVPPAASGGGGGGCKIICTKLHELGYLPDNIYAADELFGQWLRANDPYAYYGYVKWASVVVDWMESDGPQCMFWIKDKEQRGQAQRELAIKWARRIATPWAEHMAYKMGVGETDNRAGRMIMTTGMWISRLIGKYTKTTEPSKSVALGYLMWATFGVFWLLAGIK